MIPDCPNFIHFRVVVLPEEVDKKPFGVGERSRKGLHENGEAVHSPFFQKDACLWKFRQSRCPKT